MLASKNYASIIIVLSAQELSLPPRSAGTTIKTGCRTFQCLIPICFNMETEALKALANGGVLECVGVRQGPTPTDVGTR